jgi:signal peptidase II
LALLACVACLVGCDHATKLAAESTLRGHAAVTVVPGLMDLVYTENRGVAFSVLERLSIH